MIEYTSSVSNELGFGIKLKAPPEVTEDELNAILEALVDWTDTPDDCDIGECLENVEFDKVEALSKDRLPLYLEIELGAWVVHRDPRVCQPVRKVK